jgi:hypothetical protein
VSVQAAHVLAVLNSYYPSEALIDTAKNNPSGRNRAHRGPYRRSDVDTRMESRITPKRIIPDTK